MIRGCLPLQLCASSLPLPPLLDWSKAATALAAAGPISDQDWWEAFLAMMGVLAQSRMCAVAMPKLIAYALHLHR